MGVVSINSSKCRRCYSCIRSCRIKAIRISNGLTSMVEERCINCGICKNVCPQNAKMVMDGTMEFNFLFEEKKENIACLAPSFVAAFSDVRPGQVVAALKELGFDKVVEVSYGAKVVADHYKSFIKENDLKPLITTACPAVVNLVEQHYPQLIPHLVPIVSPMIATAKLIRQKFGQDVGITFIGPCIAKKKESLEIGFKDLINVILTFEELGKILADEGIIIEDLPDARKDLWETDIAGVFPLGGGLLVTADINMDLLNNKVIISEGSEETIHLLEDLAKGKVEARVLDLLYCHGCITGPGMKNNLSTYQRKSLVVDYVNQRKIKLERVGIHNPYPSLNFDSLSRSFTDRSTKFPMPDEEEIAEILRGLNKYSPEDLLNCGSCGYNSCREKAIATYQGLAEPEMCLQYLLESQQMAITDGLTGVHNHRYFQEVLQREIIRAERNGSAVSVIMIDMDFFKEYNDTYGHQIGDMILQEFAALLQNNIREFDTVARYGGDEFAIILTQTGSDEALEITERIQQKILNYRFKRLPVNIDIQLHVSVGIATYPTHAIDKRELVERADKALYRVKQKGRNQILVYDEREWE